MRFILGIIAFIVTFGLSVSVVGLVFGFPEKQTNHRVYKLKTNNHHAKHKIKSLLRRDVRNGYWRNIKVQRIENYQSMETSELYNNAEYRKAISNYVRKSSSINDSNLPQDFKYAWRQHMQAWQTQVKNLNANGYDSDYANYVDNTREINQTWYQVLRIAQRYGVNVPSRYYR